MALAVSDLLAKVKELGDAPKPDLVRAAGYVSSKKDGSERLNFTAYYEALLEAKGVSLGDGGGNEADVGFRCHQGMGGKACIEVGVLDHQDVVLENGVSTKGDVPAGFRGLQAELRFEPLPVSVDQADRGNRHVADLGRQWCQNPSPPPNRSWLRPRGL